MGHIQGFLFMCTRATRRGIFLLSFLLDPAWVATHGSDAIETIGGFAIGSDGRWVQADRKVRELLGKDTEMKSTRTFRALIAIRTGNDATYNAHTTHVNG
eukprot:TRINITY_DN780_c0_g2_i1.p1 TRINITY_DN780_c0_g2~~TRINITY_DN780_c0_g2_i1.p1  ORF type:complete len:100 (+),score=7.16 TRINITY_DN780_c0_g2_i1:244-543(+)